MKDTRDGRQEHYPRTKPKHWNKRRHAIELLQKALRHPFLMTNLPWNKLKLVCLEVTLRARPIALPMPSANVLRVLKLHYALENGT